MGLLPHAVSENHFISPVGANASEIDFPEWNIGTEQIITWSADYPTITLSILQKYHLLDGLSNYEIFLNQVPYQNSFQFIVNTQIDLDLANVFYFRLSSGNISSTTFIQSQFFEIVKASNGSAIRTTITDTATITAPIDSAIAIQTTTVDTITVTDQNAGDSSPTAAATTAISNLSTPISSASKLPRTYPWSTSMFHVELIMSLLPLWICAVD